MKRNLIVLVLSAVAFLALVGCKRGGGEGAKCAKMKDCRHGFRCVESICRGGKESACDYLKRCFPLIDIDQRETLFGPSYSSFGDQLGKGKASEAACAGQLRIISAANRMIVLTRACGPKGT